MWRKRRQRRAWLVDWEVLAAERLPQWADLEDEERDRLGGLVEWMVLTKQWEASQGFELTQEIVVTIAAHAGLLLLGLDERPYREVAAIVVQPRTITMRGARSTPVPGVFVDGPLRVLGHAGDRFGPVVLSWAAIRRDLGRPHDGQNVVIHEFAHKIDAADGVFDGTPELPRPERERWVRVCTEEYERLRTSEAPDPVLRAYGAQTPSEFFSVATEAFIERPLELEEHKPALYEALCTSYRQDPAARARRRIERVRSD